ncbi:hypothetical protein BJ138DRAFT_378266 [Hygrophoropsis aurantiaca]|uniref:Uncharacterized protein n=1 Tax=Hygrophoropsis aurantiaca TaxID=72124 RepID=A0ACB8A5E1_9AGAM|nr:hypothetical protein BJ138DRAFT_378266 [Hygrophoropsis aurantiaca]
MSSMNNITLSICTVHMPGIRPREKSPYMTFVKRTARIRARRITQRRTGKLALVKAKPAADTRFEGIIYARRAAYGEFPDEDSPARTPSALKRKPSGSVDDNGPPLARMCRVDVRAMRRTHPGYSMESAFACKTSVSPSADSSTVCIRPSIAAPAEGMPITKKLTQESFLQRMKRMETSRSARSRARVSKHRAIERKDIGVRQSPINGMHRRRAHSETYDIYECTPSTSALKRKRANYGIRKPDVLEYSAPVFSKFRVVQPFVIPVAETHGIFRNMDIQLCIPYAVTVAFDVLSALVTAFDQMTLFEESFDSVKTIDPRHRPISVYVDIDMPIIDELPASVYIECAPPVAASLIQHDSGNSMKAVDQIFHDGDKNIRNRGLSVQWVTELAQTLGFQGAWAVCEEMGKTIQLDEDCCDDCDKLEDARLDPKSEGHIKILEEQLEDVELETEDNSEDNGDNDARKFVGDMEYAEENHEEGTMVQGEEMKSVEENKCDDGEMEEECENDEEERREPTDLEREIFGDGEDGDDDDDDEKENHNGHNKGDALEEYEEYEEEESKKTTELEDLIFGGPRESPKGLGKVVDPQDAPSFTSDSFEVLKLIQEAVASVTHADFGRSTLVSGFSVSDSPTDDHVEWINDKTEVCETLGDVDEAGENSKESVVSSLLDMFSKMWA